MKTDNPFLLVGGLCSLAVAALHIAIVIGGGEWYRFFGAGEALARMAEEGDVYPAILTLCIAAVFSIWALYAFSGAGLMRRLPWLKAVLAVIAAVYLLRGLGGIPLLLMSERPYALEQQDSMVFMATSSLISFSFGVMYALGLWRHRMRASTA
ncbi:MAG: hypothetical protein ABW068_04910 [Candidatus Thiodiazotropha sp.]